MLKHLVLFMLIFLGAVIMLLKITLYSSGKRGH